MQEWMVWHDLGVLTNIADFEGNSATDVESFR
jgi:hypothetical protein